MRACSENALAKQVVFTEKNCSPLAVIGPAKSHPEVIIAAVAARDQAKAQAYAKKYKIPIVLSTYQALLDEPSIDAVYIPLPNGCHYEWAVKALEAGKHVLLEKPSTSNAAEAAKLFRSPLLSGPKAPVLLEAFHYRFHPAWQKLLSLVDATNILEVHSSQFVPKGITPLDDIRFQFGLAGGSLMDFGTYTVSTLRQLFGTEPEECLEASYRPMPPGYDKACDQSFTGKWRFPNGGIGSMEADLVADGRWSFPMMSEFPTIKLPKLTIKHRDVAVADQNLPKDNEHSVTKNLIMWNHIWPFLYHRFDVEEMHVIKSKSNGSIVRKWAEKTYLKEYIGKTGLDSWSTYRHQLEEFVNRVRGRHGSGVWVEAEDSVKQMEMIDGAYLKAGLPIRPSMTLK